MSSIWSFARPSASPRRSLRSRLIRVSLLLSLLLSSARAWAQPATDAAPQPATDAAGDLERAKLLFREGVVLFQAGDHERALERFLQSREAHASAKNTSNAALCLDRLGRFDEALEMYELVLLKFAGELGEEDRTALAPAMAALRQKVGSVDVSSNVEGASVVIDGRARGKLPLTTPIRVLGGKRVVRVLRSGYVTAEQTVDVEPGRNVRVDVKLEPLAAAGLLRVEDADNPGAEVFVDRVVVGTAPWEGTLGPGHHVVWTRKGDVGSAPMTAFVVQGQAALVRAKSSRLGPRTRIDVEPKTARVTADGVDLGGGPWEGRLPIGSHTFVVAEEGYVSQTRTVAVADEGRPSLIQVRLPVDADHPRWPKAKSGQLGVELVGGPALAPSLGADAESGCPDACSGSPFAFGFTAGVRASYRFPIGLSLELGGGYLSLGSAFSREVGASWPASDPRFLATYVLDDSISVRGPFVTGGVAWRFGDRLALVPRVAMGVVFAASRDEVTGSGAGGGETRPASIDGAGSVARSTAVFVEPEVAGEMAFGSYRVGLALGVAVFLTEGPRSEHGSIGVPPADACTGDDGRVGCSPQSDVVAGERAHGRFALVSPRAYVGRVF